MRSLYHLCVASHDEVLFRDESDFKMFTNLMALAAVNTNEELLADALMSTHFHLVVMSHDPSDFIRYLRHSYTNYFNNKYHRAGRLGPKGFHMTEVSGVRRRMATVCYVLRNGLHHAQSATPFGYRHCTVNSLFDKEMGRSPYDHLITSQREIVSLLPRHAKIHEKLKFDESGVVLRESFMELAQVENMFVTPRNFLYHMNRISDEVWQKEQLEDGGNEAPVTLDTIERGFGRQSIRAMLECEKGFRYDSNKMNDISVCNIIDNQLIGKYKAASVYCLSDVQKHKISGTLEKEFSVPQFQIDRCLGK